MQPSNIAQLLKDKVPSYRDLAIIPIADNGDDMVPLQNTEKLYAWQIGEEMIPYTGNIVYVRRTIARMLADAATRIPAIFPGCMLQIHYGFRHPNFQKWKFDQYMAEIADRADIVDKEQYAHIFIAEPSVAGHPTGGAVDVTIVRQDTKEMIDMGTPLRAFCDETVTFYPFVSSDVWSNRNLLRNIMVQAGFAPFDGEWWHFSYGDREWAAYYRQPHAFYGPVPWNKES